MANYTYLVTDIIEATENDGSEFVSAIPRMVNRVEERLTKALDDFGLVTTTTVTLSAGKNSLTLPSETRYIKNLRIEDSGTKINLLQRTDEFIYDYWPVSASTGTPKYYAKKTNTDVIVAPTASATYSGELVYVARPATLTSVNQTNYFSDFCYDALFYGCMVEAGDFMKNYTVSNYYEQRYNNAVELLRNQSRRTRRDDMEAPASMFGENTINGGE
mgnify:CR=1 FL=1|tara:strand:- start:167 stop:817 length:651 start_codon:yes stop_codon:yes gene_type:complete